jgi:hypothetical protein
MISKKQLENVGYQNYFARIVTSDATNTRQTKPRIVIPKPVFNKENSYFHKQIVLKFKKKKALNLLHLAHSCVLC